jgi:hypothetical protein
MTATQHRLLAAAEEGAGCRAARRENFGAAD